MQKYTNFQYNVSSHILYLFHKPISQTSIFPFPVPTIISSPNGMARYDRESGSLVARSKTDKSPPTEVRCYTWRTFSQQQYNSSASASEGAGQRGMAEATDGPQQVKTLQYTRRGLRMVGDPSLFDLQEPVWHPDEKVSC